MEQPERTRETERRRATILFADLTGFTSFVAKAGVEDAYSVVTGCLKLLDGIARRNGASADKYMDDCVMAVFGVPRAIENAPRAAVNAAIEMLDAVRAYAGRAGQPLGIHIGIDIGSVFSGDVSGPVLREFAVMGDAVNLAARLKDLAPVGEVYVGPETWRATREDFAYRAHAPIAINGKEHPVAVYELRSRELAALRAAVADLAADRGGVISLVAEAGVGKSRLLDELVASPEAADTLVLQGRSLSIGRELGFHPFVDLLRGWIGLGGGADEDSARERLVGALGRERELALLEAQRP
jgi:adenylate cyclase